MSDPMQKSLQGYSQFVSFENSTQLQESLCGVSQKIPIPNASLVNRQEFQKDKKALQKMKEEEAIKEEIEQQNEEQANQFLNVGKWQKPKSMLKNSKDLSKNISQEDQPKHSQKSTLINQSSNNPSKAPKSNLEAHHPHTHKNNQSLMKNSDIHIHKSNKPLTVPQQPHWHPHQKYQKNESQKNQEEEDDEDEEEEEEEESEEESSEEEEQESQSEEEQESEQQDDDDEDDEDEDQNQIEEQDQPEQQEEIQDKFATGVDERSSEAVETVFADTSVLGATPKPSKWSKKKPLQTKTKYQQKSERVISKQGHQRLNSATFPNQLQDDAIEDELENSDEQWGRVEKILLRLDLLL